MVKIIKIIQVNINIRSNKIYPSKGKNGLGQKIDTIQVM